MRLLTQPTSVTMEMDAERGCPRAGQVRATSRVTEPESSLPEEVSLGCEAERQPYPAQGGSRESQALGA